MSRSYRTAPYQVRLAQDPAKRRPRHDHRFHDCDLPNPRHPDLGPQRPYDAVQMDEPCSWVPVRSARDLAYHCPCSHCAYSGGTPPRELRRTGRQLLSQVALRPAPEDLFDFVDDRATPRR